ncbi:spermatogenesis-associated protein 2 [Eucyclogobius newberryi]|uniref:spermatogenesis-associated protein 2 n=1 Tax=Eucyclogobius newberryi TaxID=166745 RepID=UPI003B594A81
MQHDSGPEGPQQVSHTWSHRALFEDYLSSHVTLCPEPGPCRDEDILGRGAQALLQHPMPEPECSATLTRLCHHVLPLDPTHLPGLVRATELLETLCLNLYQQPWRKEIRNIKTFTGAFVYCLLPALGSGTLQSILASIGYLPNELSPSEYILCEDASPEGALQVAFQLLLTRALCLHLLHLQQHNRPSLQECVERLKLKLWPAESSQCSESMAIGPEGKGGDQTEGEEEDPEAELSRAVCPKASGRAEDQSIHHLHWTYPDLVFRGRPLLHEDDDPTLSQNTALYPHRRHAQRARVPPSYRPPNQHITENEDLSGPLGLSLHITLRPQTVRLPNCTQQPLKEDTSGLCEENVDSPAQCKDEDVSKKESDQGCSQDQTTSIGTGGEDPH